MEILFEIIFEILLQGGAELLMELFTRKAKPKHYKPKKPMHPALAGLLWFAAGAVIGGLSLLAFPHSFLKDPVLRVAYLVLVPLLLGAVMGLVGRKRLANGQDIVPLDKFGYAALFAFGMALVRFIYAAVPAA